MYKVNYDVGRQRALVSTVVFDGKDYCMILSAIA